MQLLLRDLASGLSVTGLIVSPAFGYAGVGFPVVGMNLFAQTWSAMLPLRWYMAVLFGQAARGLPTYASAKPFAILAGLAILYASLALLRLRAISKRVADRAPPEEEAIPPAAPGIGGAFTTEWKRVLANRGALAMMVLAPVIYGLYYPQPYLTQILHKVPIAVVDNDLSQFSRDLIDMVDASGSLSVKVRASTLEEARRSLDRGEVFAIFAVPPDAQRDMLKGNEVELPIYADATYLFVYRTTAPGIAAAVQALSFDLIARGARSDGSLAKAAIAEFEPRRYSSAAYFQSGRRLCKLYRAGSVCADHSADIADGCRHVDRGRAAWSATGPLRTVLGRGIAHLTIYLPALALYFLVLPRVYGFSALGHPLVLFTLCGAVSPGHEFPRPDGGCLVQISRDRGACLPRHQHSAALPCWLFLATRGDPGPRDRRRTYLSVRFCDLRPDPPRSDGGAICPR